MRTALQSAVLILASAGSFCADASESVPFSRELSLWGGIAQARGVGVAAESKPAATFFYARAFTKPEPERFLIRVIADTVWTQLKTSDQPLARLAAQESTQATLIRFGFSGCYLWSREWMACMDDGPRMSWLSQGKENAQVLGSFPLGVSAHNATLFPWIISARAEVGRWDSREQGKELNNTLALFFVGAGYNW